MIITVEDSPSGSVQFECADTWISKWVSSEILRDRTYPHLPFVTDVQVIVDAGANCGATTVHLARQNPNAQVHAIEPGGEAGAILARNATAYPNVTVHHIGLHSTDRTAQLYRGAEDSITSSLEPRDVTGDQSEMVQLRDGRRWASDQGIDRIDVLKLDVEGAEIAVLESLAPLIPTMKVIYVEYDSRQARRRLEEILGESHDLYFSMLMALDQGDCIYLAKELANRPEATEFLGELYQRLVHGTAETTGDPALLKPTAAGNAENTQGDQPTPIHPVTRGVSRQIDGLETFFRDAFVSQWVNGVSGDYVEFGSWGGNTLRVAYEEARDAHVPRHLWAFDSFEGLPAPADDRDNHPGWSAGGTGQGGVEEFRRACDAHGIPREAYTTVTGYYDAVLPNLPAEKAPHDIAVAYIDCNMYSSTVSVLEFLAPRLKAGMIVAFDDYYCWSPAGVSGERSALSEFLETHPQWHFERYKDIHRSGVAFVVEPANQVNRRT
ncbi:MAG: FkbM family methyltransferase [Aquihabitans sp.]